MHRFPDLGTGDTDRWRINLHLCATCQYPLNQNWKNCAIASIKVIQLHLLRFYRTPSISFWMIFSNITHCAQLKAWQKILSSPLQSVSKHRAFQHNTVHLWFFLLFSGMFSIWYEAFLDLVYNMSTIHFELWIYLFVFSLFLFLYFLYQVKVFDWDHDTLKCQLNE